MTLTTALTTAEEGEDHGFNPVPQGAQAILKAQTILFAAVAVNYFCLVSFLNLAEAGFAAGKMLRYVSNRSRDSGA